MTNAANITSVKFRPYVCHVSRTIAYVQSKLTRTLGGGWRPVVHSDAERPGYGRGRDALIDATIRVVAAQGVRGLTYRAVATEAGVTHGTVQHHFANLDELLEAALEKCIQVSLAGSSQPPESGRIDDYVATLGESVRSTLDEQVFQFELVLESAVAPNCVRTSTATTRTTVR